MTTMMEAMTIAEEETEGEASTVAKMIVGEATEELEAPSTRRRRVPREAITMTTLM